MILAQAQTVLLISMSPARETLGLSQPRNTGLASRSATVILVFQSPLRHCELVNFSVTRPPRAHFSVYRGLSPGIRPWSPVMTIDWRREDTQMMRCLWHEGVHSHLTHGTETGLYCSQQDAFLPSAESSPSLDSFSWSPMISNDQDPRSHHNKSLPKGAPQ